MLTSRKLMAKCVVEMDGWCDGQHSVVIHSLNHHATVWVCTMVCVCIEECDVRQGSPNGVWLVVDGDEWRLWLLS